MSYDDLPEDPFEKLLDDESDIDFGEVVLHSASNPEARSFIDGNLEQWTAADFASIYHRFQPHLIRHARRFLSSQVKAEEVVQDAFLFLMTALPEIDNELGVLKFLKWKIRLLSLDLIKLEVRNRTVSLPDGFELASQDDPFDEELSRADDAAVIRLALSKLSPRQRQALVSSVQEERSTAQIAAELGTSENATRQLVFRARAAFKKALLGDVDVSGLSSSALLSVAFRKAALDARKNATQVGAFLALTALSIGIFANFGHFGGSTSTGDVIAMPEESIAGIAKGEPLPDAGKADSVNVVPNLEDAIDLDGVSKDTGEASLARAGQVGQYDDMPPEEDDTASVQSVERSLENEAKDRSESIFLMPGTFRSAFSTSTANAYFYNDSRPEIFESFEGQSIQVFAGTGVSAFIDFRTEDLTIYNFILQLRLEDDLVYAVPTQFEKQTNYDGELFEMVFSGRDFYLIEQTGNVVSDSLMIGADARVSISLNMDGEVLASSLSLQR